MDDVAVVCAEDRVVAWFGGTGRPMACPDVLAAANPYSFAVLDVDSDGEPDLVTINSAGTLLSVVRGVGGRNFAPQYLLEVAGAAHPELDAADLDGDGDTDLMTRGETETRVLVSDGKGSFAAGQVLGRPEGCLHGAPVDLDGDGHLDLPSSCPMSGLSWRAGLGDATFAAEALVLMSEVEFQTFTFADLDGDDWLDLLLMASDGLKLARGEGPLMFGALTAIGPVIRVPGLRVADLDGELPLEVLLFGEDYQSDELPGIWLLVGDGLGGYELAGKQSLYVRFSDLQIGDFTGDGQVDIVTASVSTAVYDGAIHLLESAP